MSDTIMGFVRPNGQFGIRNYITVISLVQCANRTCTMIAEQTGSAPIYTDYGCGQYEDATRRTELGMIRAGTSPNIYGCVLVSLGCQWTDPEKIKKEIEKFGKKVVHICIQDVGGVSKACQLGVAAIRQMQAEIAQLKRVPCPMNQLVIGVTCGGSDWTSSICGNNCEGVAVRLLSQKGCSFLDWGIRGLPGGEELAVNLAVNREVGCRILDIASEYRQDVYKTTGQHISDVNPTPGNKAGGITTMIEKALSNSKMRGGVPIQGVLEIGQQIPSGAHGMFMLDERMGGNDVFVTTSIAMAGAHAIIFTTGNGSPLGNALLPIIKLTGNPRVSTYLSEMIDYSSSDVLAGNKTVEQAGQELYDVIIDVLNGKPTKAELIGDVSYSVPPVGKC